MDEKAKMIDQLEERLKTAGVVCHELNQPLQVISGLSELIKLDLPEDSPFYSQFQKLESQVEKMAEVTHRLMKVIKGL